MQGIVGGIDEMKLILLLLATVCVCMAQSNSNSEISARPQRSFVGDVLTRRLGPGNTTAKASCQRCKQ